MPIGSIAGGLIGQQGAQQGGQMAFNAAQNGAMTNQNILRDQQQANRVAQSPYMGAGREALSQIGQLMGWGNLQTNGGDDDWRFSNWGGSGDPTITAGQQGNARANVLALAGGPLPKAPTFARLNVPTTFEADPGYAFRRDEGLKALDRTAAAKGKLLSGSQFKAAEEYNSGLASQEYGNWWNRYTGGTQFNNAADQQEFTNSVGLNDTQYGRERNVLADWMALAGMGQGSATNYSGTNTSLAGNMGNAFATAGREGGNALGAGYAKGAENMASGIGHATTNAMTLGYMGFGGSTPLFGGGGSSYGTPNPNVGSVGGQSMDYYRGYK